MKQAPALRSNNQTHPPRTHRPWHRRTRSPRSAVGTTAPGRPDDALLGPSDVRQWMSIRQHGRGRDGCRMLPSLVRVLVGNVGGYRGSPGRPEPCWAGGRGRMGRCGDADARKASGCPSWCRSASGRGIVCPWLSARGLWVCAASAGSPWTDPGRTNREFQEMDSVSLRLATCDGDCDSVPLLAGCPPFKVFPGNQSWRRAGGGPEQKVRFVGSIRFR